MAINQEGEMRKEKIEVTKEVTEENKGRKMEEKGGENGSFEAGKGGQEMKNEKQGMKNELQEVRAGEKEKNDRGIKLCKKQMKQGKGDKDQRFWKNERAIQRAFFRARKMVSATILARRAKVSRATLYRHHRGVYQIMPNIEKQMLSVFEQQMTGVKFKQGVKVQWLFYRMLSYIRKNRTEFREVVQRGDERVLEQMVDELMPKIVRSYHIPMKDEEIVRIYQKEIVAVVETWVLDDFEASEMSVLKDIMYLTQTARKHLITIGR